MPLSWLPPTWFNRRRSPRPGFRPRRHQPLVQQLEARELLAGVGFGTDPAAITGANSVSGRIGPVDNSLPPTGSGGTGTGQTGSDSGSSASVDRFIAAVYRDLLQRWPGADEVATWEHMLAAGLSRPQLVADFISSAEYDTSVIRNGYNTFLGRGPDQGGFSTWMQFLQHGGTAEQFDGQLLGSQEYFSRQGANAGSWIAGLYRDVLARAADDAALSYWLQSLQHGATRAGIAFAIVTSHEAATQFVAGAYESYLNRPGGDGEVNYWANSVQQGATGVQIVTQFVASDEYFQLQSNNLLLDPPYYPLSTILDGGPVVSVPGGQSGSTSGGTSGSGGQTPGDPGANPVGPFPTKPKVLQPVTQADPLSHSGVVGSQALLDLAQYLGDAANAGTPTAAQLNTFVFNSQKSAVLVNVRARPEHDVVQMQADFIKMQADLIGLGMTDISTTPGQNLITGYLPVSAISELPGVPGFSAVTPVYAALHRVGAVTTQGDQLSAADAFRAGTGANGNGVTVGILSDSVNQVDSHVDLNPDVGIAESQRTGDLPSRGVQVLKDGSATDTDEGRGMAEIVYDMAPGANLAFYTSDGGPQAMAQGIDALAKSGAKVIVDDTAYPDEPFFNDGVLAKAVDQVSANNNVVYVTSAGNEADHAWTGDFRPVTATVGTETGTFQGFGASGSSVLQSFTLAPGQILNLSFEWNDAFLEGGSNLPLYQVQNNMAVLVTDATGTQVYASFADDNQNTDEALQRVVFQNNGKYGTNQFALAFELKDTAPGASPPTWLKWIRFDNNAPAQYQGAPAIFGHAAATQAVTVGAVPVSQPTAAEGFSSQGPATILFDSNGYRLAAADLRNNKPSLAGPDGVNTANFPGQPEGSPLPPGAFPVFYGTSAAAAHVAAAAALLRQGNPGASASVIAAGLQTNAIRLSSALRDPAAGMGLLRVIPLPQPSPSGLRVPTNVDISKRLGNEWEEEIAVNPTNPLQMAAQSNTDSGAGGLGSFFATSADGGVTWTGRIIGDGADGLPLSFGDPSVAWDSFGNLFVSYIGLSSSGSGVDQCTVLLSTDGGLTLTLLQNFTCQDQPKVTTGAGEVWEVFNNGDIEAAGAAVTGLGAVGAFGAVQAVPSSAGENFGNIAIAPGGQVLVSFQSAGSGVGPDQIRTALDPDGLGPAGFSSPTVASSTNVGAFRPITPQAIRTIDTDGRVAYDQSTGPHRGRVYLDYVDASSTSTDSTNIFVRFSDDNGTTWSPPVRVNDDTTGRSHFWPRLAVDPTTGNVALSWYDCRNDPGFGPGDTDGIPNTDTEFFASASLDGGATFSANVQVASGPSNAITNANGGNQYGDYTGLAFFNGIIHPCWADNSATLQGNPDRPNFDIATAAVTLSSVVVPPLPPALAPDIFEVNDTSDTATNFGTFQGFKTITGLTIGRHPLNNPDYDWYRWTAGKTGTFNFTVSTETSGNLEIHLFTLRNNILVELGQNAIPGVPVHNLAALVSKGEPLLLEVKGLNLIPGQQEQAVYDLSVSLV